jgi:hypothetical protein
VLELIVNGGILVIFKIPPGANIRLVALSGCGNVIEVLVLTTTPPLLTLNVVVCAITHIIPNMSIMIKMYFFIFFIKSPESM